ncbi:MAG: hypothetical protein ACLFSA_05840 [Spirochaetaceae bacterium]
METENTPSALEQIRNASAAGFVVHESRLCAELTEEELSQVESLAGEKGQYYFDPEVMSPHYAGIMAAMEEKNYPELAAKKIRDDSKKYPRTTPLLIFLEAPFSFDEETLQGVVHTFDTEERYRDLRTCKASNGAEHIYSTTHLSPAQAQYICEWHEVGREENQ